MHVDFRAILVIRKQKSLVDRPIRTIEVVEFRIFVWSRIMRLRPDPSRPNMVKIGNTMHCRQKVTSSEVCFVMMFSGLSHGINRPPGKVN